MNAFRKPKNLWALFFLLLNDKECNGCRICNFNPLYAKIEWNSRCTALNLKSSKHGMESICMNLHEDVEHNRMLIIPISSKTSFWYERT